MSMLAVKLGRTSRPLWPGCRLALTFVACVVLLTSSAFAQGTVTIYGTVSDKSGAIVPGAEVTVTNTLTGAARGTISNKTGGYVVSQLPVGIYQVRVQLQGFKSSVQDRIPVQVDENRQVNLVLEVFSTQTHSALFIPPPHEPLMVRLPKITPIAIIAITINISTKVTKK